MEKKKVSLNNYNQSIPNVILDNNETTTVAFETGNVFSNYFAKLVIYIYIYIYIYIFIYTYHFVICIII